MRSVIDAIGMVVIVLIAAAEMRAGRLTAQGLLMYVYVGRLVIAPASQMASTYLWAQGVRASFEQVRRLLVQRPQLEDGPRPVASFQRALEVRGARFSYGYGPVLNGVSVSIQKGQMVALVGPSGAGKSTLADLILRLLDPLEGAILLDGVDVREFRLADYRRLFGVVPQDIWLVHDTVRVNIVYGREGLSQADVERAVRIANAHEFIMRLPQGYDTVLGDRGVRLSGGERQRLALARAVVHRPAILLFDEATSALDSESERHVQLAIESVVKEATAIVIAHRLSTVRRADAIVVLDRGRMMDVGRHDELLMRCPLYRRLVELQYGMHDSLLENEPVLEESHEA